MKCENLWDSRLTYTVSVHCLHRKLHWRVGVDFPVQILQQAPLTGEMSFRNPVVSTISGWLNMKQGSHLAAALYSLDQLPLVHSFAPMS